MRVSFFKKFDIFYHKEIGFVNTTKFQIDHTLLSTLASVAGAVISFLFIINKIIMGKFKATAAFRLSAFLLKALVNIENASLTFSWLSSAFQHRGMIFLTYLDC